VRKRLAACIVALVALFGFLAGTFAAPSPAEAACKVICCPGGIHCITCCQAPCPTLVCPPY